MKLDEMLKTFIKNVKEFVTYITKVDFRELFINVLILACIVFLATFIYIPVAVIKDLVFGFVTVFVNMPPLIVSLYNWVFDLASAIFAFLAFMFLFNKRYEDIEEVKRQINEKPVKKDNKEESNDDLELPKAKKN